MVLEKVPVSLRGELTRWLIEVDTGVYVGDVNAMVRERLWVKCTSGRRKGSVIQAWSTNREQGFDLRAMGLTDRQVVDYDGLKLVRKLAEALPTTDEAEDSAE
ncbi:MAG: type I-E CRISPR-associated endoribonuclease Cas2e [Anaerolineae bacterium]